MASDHRHFAFSVYNRHVLVRLLVTFGICVYRETDSQLAQIVCRV